MIRNPNTTSFTLIIENAYFEKDISDIDNQAKLRNKFWTTTSVAMSADVLENIPDLEDSVKRNFGYYLGLTLDKHLTMAGVLLNNQISSETSEIKQLKDSVTFKVIEISYGSLVLNISVENIGDLAESLAGGFSLLVSLIEGCAPIALSDSIPNIKSSDTKATMKDLDGIELAFSKYNNDKNSNKASTAAPSAQTLAQPISNHRLDTFIRPIKNPYIAIFIPVLLAMYILHLTIERLDKERLAMDQRLIRIEKRESSYLDRMNALLDKSMSDLPSKKNNEEVKN